MKTLSQICEIVSDKLSVNELINANLTSNYISTENMLPNKGGVVAPSSVPTTGKVTAYKTGDVLVSNIRPYFKKIWFALNDGGCSNDVLVFRAKKDVSPEYLHYVLADDSFFDYAMKTSKGTKMPRGDKKALMEYEIVKMNYSSQCQAATILKRIDDLIKTNTKIHENLEQQAQALSDKWVSEHMDCITMVPLAEIAEINPETYSPKDKWTFVNYLDTSSITNGVVSEVQLISPEIEKLPSRARRIVKANDIVYSTVRPNQLHFGIISNPLENMLVSTGFSVIRSKYAYISSPYIYHFLTSPDFIEKMQQLAEQSTSTFPSVKPSDIGTCLIPCADETEMTDITDKINDMYAMVSANQQENKCLANLRDTLLPKLMNGEIDVSQVQI